MVRSIRRSESSRSDANDPDTAATAGAVAERSLIRDMAGMVVKLGASAIGRMDNVRGRRLDIA
jgi:hypothetical protein